LRHTTPQRFSSRLLPVVLVRCRVKYKDLLRKPTRVRTTLSQHTSCCLDTMAATQQDGTGRCLQAVTIALNRACAQGEKIWFTSTLHLQLASLEFCRACR
ncbi:unnamed protein product, partial [Laminaria digitata]